MVALTDLQRRLLAQPGRQLPLALFHLHSQLCESNWTMFCIVCLVFSGQKLNLQLPRAAPLLKVT